MITLTTFKARPYAGEPDLQPICDLLNTCDTVDKLDETQTVDDLRRELDDPTLDQARDLRIWEDASGRVVAWGQLEIPKDNEDDALIVGCYFRVHPATRNQGLEEEIIAWAGARIGPVAQARGVPGYLQSGLRMSTPEYIAYRQAVLERHGFTPNRYFFRMVRPLDQPIAEPQLPAGYSLRHVASDADLEQWIAAFNLSFIDHWDFHPLTPEQAQHWLGSPKYQAAGNLIAVAPDGVVAAFCLCWIDPDDNARNARLDGWISDLGTRRGHRQIGLGRAMLLAGMHWLKAQGMTVAKLDVDAENPSGALRLYESAGFAKLHTTAMYRKAV